MSKGKHRKKWRKSIFALSEIGLFYLSCITKPIHLERCCFIASKYMIIIH